MCSLLGSQNVTPPLNCTKKVTYADIEVLQQAPPIQVRAFASASLALEWAVQPARVLAALCGAGHPTPSLPGWEGRRLQWWPLGEDYTTVPVV